ncbi:MAG: hypothetical protein AAGF71_01590 [Pseudomonadota bacterium]
MGTILTASIVLSLVGLVYLASTDPKRRRAHGQSPVNRRLFLWPARLFVFGPGIVLIAIAHWSGLAIWAGAVTVLGWIMAAVSPSQYAQAQDVIIDSTQNLAKSSVAYVSPAVAAVGTMAGNLSSKIVRLRPATEPPVPAGPGRVAELEARIVALEARLHRLEGTSKPDANEAEFGEQVVIPAELPGPKGVAR